MGHLSKDGSQSSPSSLGLAGPSLSTEGLAVVKGGQQQQGQEVVRSSGMTGSRQDATPARALPRCCFPLDRAQLLLLFPDCLAQASPAQPSPSFSLPSWARPGCVWVWGAVVGRAGVPRRQMCPCPVLICPLLMGGTDGQAELELHQALQGG